MNMDLIFKICSLDLIEGSTNVVGTMFGTKYVNNDFGVESMEYIYDFQ